MTAHRRTGPGERFGLLTNHTGDQEAGYRIIFDPEGNLFGLWTTRADGVEIWRPQEEALRLPFPFSYAYRPLPFRISRLP
jgi:hypothetical protein